MLKPESRIWRGFATVSGLTSRTAWDPPTGAC